jgi:hypothetical protein
MNNGKRRVAWLVTIVLAGAAVSGCSIKASQLTPNTHYAYPNANITPLGSVSASTSRTRVFIPKSIDQEMMDEVITKALKEKGGDLLINSKVSTEVVSYPLVFFNIFTTTLRVDGTAAKQVVGQQQLR